MSTPEQKAFEDLLARVRDGDRDALNELVPLVYDELQQVARGQRRRWSHGVSMQTTSLLHEAYVRLAGQEEPNWKDRAHFLAVAATAMRQILIDHARRRDAKKRGGDRTKVSFEEIEALLASPDEEELEARDEVLILLDEALVRLNEVNERPVRILECRFFAGMTIPETAEALDLSPSTVSRGWNMARTWLFRELQDAVEGNGE